MNIKLLKNFEDYLSKYTPHNTFGESLLTIFPFFKIYSEYWNNYSDKALPYYEKMKLKNHSFI